VRKEPPNELLPEDISLQIGFTYQVMGDHTTAHQLYLDLYRQFPTSLQLIIQYAWFLFLRSKSDESLGTVSRIVNQGLTAHQCEPTLLLIAGRIAMKQDDVAMAYQQYRYCRSYCNDNPFFWCGLGVLYYKNEQTQDAVIAFQRALYLQNEMTEAWLNIGLIFEEQGEISSAQKIYQTGQSKCPGAPEFDERLKALAGHAKSGFKPGAYSLIDVDDLKFIRPPPETFALEYVAAVPEMPPDCLGVDQSVEGFKTLATFPKSYFL
jgi:tetratricopeptide (TPR) repeat protein